MSILLFTMIFLISYISSEMTAPGIDREISDGARSLGYNVVYGDEDLLVMNEVVRDSEKYTSWKTKTDLNHAIPPLPAEDVKCLMSVDRYCSKDMGEVKNVLVEALKDDCSKCTTKQKENAGRVVASMMAHDPVAWKLFLTRSMLQILPKKKELKEERFKYKIIKDLGYIERVTNRFIMPGVSVRVKVYATEKIK